MERLTHEQIKRLSPRAANWIVDGLVEHSDLLPQYGIDTPRRLRHFMAQIAQESDGLQVTKEYASGSAYEGRKDLGNTETGDGRRFRGRGLIQTTGRYNHHVLSQRTGVDYVNDPERLERFPDALVSALDYWKRKNINPAADRDDIVAVTKKVNGGTNGLKDRRVYLARAKKIWPDEESEMATRRRGLSQQDRQSPSGRGPVRPVYRRLNEGLNATDWRNIQRVLAAKGYYSGEIDGLPGPQTSAALVAFKKQNKLSMPDGSYNDDYTAEVARKLQSTKLSPEKVRRKQMTEGDLAKRSKTVQVNRTGQAGGAGVVGVGFLVMVQDWFRQAREFMQEFGLPILGFLLVVLGAWWVWQNRETLRLRLKEYKEGRYTPAASPAVVEEARDIQGDLTLPGEDADLDEEVEDEVVDERELEDEIART